MSVVGTLSVRIIGDDKDLRKKLNDNAKAVAKWSAAAAAAAAAVTAAFVRSGIATGDALAKTAEKLGTTTEALSKLRFAADQTGVSSQTLDMALQRVTRRIAEAAQGSGEAVNALKELGLNAEELNKLPLDQQMLRIADAMDGVGSQSDRVRLAMRLFDSEGVALVNTLKGGSDAMQRYFAEAEKLGLVLSQVDAEKIQEAEDAFGRLGRQIEVASMKLGAEFAPLIVEIEKQFQSFIQEAGGLDTIVGGAFDGIIQTGRFVLNTADAIGREFTLAASVIESAFWGLNTIIYEVLTGIVTGSREAINAVIEAANKIPGIELAPLDASEFEQSLTNTLEYSKNAMLEANESIRSVFTEPLAGEEFIQWVDDTLKATEERVAQAKENMGGSVMTTVGGMSEADKEKLAADLETLQEHFATIEELELEHYGRRQEILEQAKEQGLLTDQEYRDYTLQNAQEYNDAMEKLDRDRAKANLDNLKSVFKGMSALMSSENSKLFMIGKAAAIAEATVDGYAAAVASYKKGAQIGGPPVGAAFAAASLAATGAQIASIASTQMGGGGAGAAAGGGGASAVVEGNAAQAAANPSRSQDQVVNISLSGEVFGREQVRGLIGEINEAIADGAVLRLA